MRVLFVTAHYPPDFVSGATLQVQRLAEHAAAAGHDVAVFAGAIISGLPDGTTARQRLGGVDITWIGTSERIEQDDDRNWYNPGATSALATLLDEFEPDVVHAHTLQTLGSAGLDAALDRGIRVVLTMHDLWWWCARLFLVDPRMRPCPLVTDAGFCPCARTPAWRADRAAQLGSTLARIDEILVPSPIMADLLAANGLDPRRISVDENNVEITISPDSHERQDDGDVQFAYVGGDHPVKGVDVLLDAARRMHGIPGWRLTTYGVRARKMPSGLPVMFADPYDPPAAGAVLSEADVLVIPSIARESFSIAAREALLAGTAVITSDCLGPEEVVHHGENGFVVPTGDSAALAGVMRRLVADRQLLTSLRHGAGRKTPPLRSPRQHTADLLARYASPPPPNRHAPPHRVVVVTAIPPSDHIRRILAALAHHGVGVEVAASVENLAARLSMPCSVLIDRSLDAAAEHAVRHASAARGLSVVSERAISDGVTAAELRAATDAMQRASPWWRSRVTSVCALISDGSAWSAIEDVVRATLSGRRHTTLTVVDSSEVAEPGACDIALVVGCDERAWMLPSLRGAATIVPPDHSAAADGRTGMVASGPAEWGLLLERLLDDPTERALVAAAARRRVMLHHGPHSLATQVLDALDRQHGA